MKANAPEKIYIQPNAHDGWFESNPHSSIFVEYVRKDAFIKKACEYWYQYNQDVVKGRVSGFTVDVERFKKYMEGE